LLRFGADRVLREPLEHVRAEGFSIEVLERSKLRLVERLLARKPGPGRAGDSSSPAGSIIE
jgi:hypothetical protein